MSMRSEEDITDKFQQLGEQIARMEKDGCDEHETEDAMAAALSWVLGRTDTDPMYHAAEWWVGKK